LPVGLTVRRSGWLDSPSVGLTSSVGLTVGAKVIGRVGAQVGAGRGGGVNVSVTDGSGVGVPANAAVDPRPTIMQDAAATASTLVLTDILVPFVVYRG
jgi:hypothetical protein